MCELFLVLISPIVLAYIKVKNLVFSPSISHVQSFNLRAFECRPLQHNSRIKSVQRIRLLTHVNIFELRTLFIHRHVITSQGSLYAHASPIGWPLTHPKAVGIAESMKGHLVEHVPLKPRARKRLGNLREGES